MHKGIKLTKRYSSEEYFSNTFNAGTVSTFSNHGLSGIFPGYRNSDGGGGIWDIKVPKLYPDVFMRI